MNQRLPFRVPAGYCLVEGVSAGAFRPELWKTQPPALLPEFRRPLIEPLTTGQWRNIYAPSVVALPRGGWRIFYGAWDGVSSGNDRIYSMETRDFMQFTKRHTVIEHGDFQHVCNVSAVRLPDGSFRLCCTGLPMNSPYNRPVVFRSPDGVNWNGVKAPYPARLSDLVPIHGYPGIETSDINGMNVLMYEDGQYRLYFADFKQWGPVWRASSTDASSFHLDGECNRPARMPNDIRRIDGPWGRFYLMAYHQNGAVLSVANSSDGLKFTDPVPLWQHRDEMDRYMVAVGWVTRANTLHGLLYGAGAVKSLDRNRIFAAWLQKRAVFRTEDGRTFEPAYAVGPDRQLIAVPGTRALQGTWTIVDEDGKTPRRSLKGTLSPGQVVRL